MCVYFAQLFHAILGNFYSRFIQQMQIAAKWLNYTHFYIRNMYKQQQAKSNDHKLTKTKTLKFPDIIHLHVHPNMHPNPLTHNILSCT